MTPPEPWIGSQKNAATLSAPSSATLARSVRDRRRDQRLGVAALRMAVGVGRRDVVLRGQRQVEAAVEDGQRGQPGAGGRRAVVAALQRDEVLLARPAACVPVLDDEAHRGVHRLRAAEREVGARQRGGRDLGQLGGQADRRLAGKAEVAGGVGQLAQLRGGGLHHAFLAVADVHAPQAGEGVQQFVALSVGEPGTARAGQQQRAACFVLAPGGNGVDEVRAVERGKFIEAVRVHRRCPVCRRAEELKCGAPQRGAAFGARGRASCGCEAGLGR